MTGVSQKEEGISGIGEKGAGADNLERKSNFRPEKEDGKDAGKG